MLIKRNLQFEIEKLIKSPEAIVITGMRRVGKTTMMQMLFDEIQSKNKLFFDLDNPRQQTIFDVIDYDTIPSKLEEYGINPNNQIYIFLDEIQSMPKIPSIIKYLIDHYQIKFFMSGSASYYIRNMFTESLAGRKYLFELFPFNFNEFLQAKKINSSSIATPISQSTYLHYTPYFEEYLKYGGFPAVVLENNKPEKQNKLNDIFSAYWSLEVERLSDFRKKDKVRNFIFLLMERSGSKIDITKLSKELGVAKETLESYLTFLQDTYLISTIPPYSTNRDVEIRGAKKLYFIDTGLLNQFSRLDRGSIFENAIFNLLRHHGKVQYWQQKDGQEIDFIVDEKIAYEVKLSANEQHLKTLVRRANKINIKKQLIVSQQYFDNSKTIYGFML